MEVKVNGKSVKVFTGAEVEHAIMAYSYECYREVKQGEKIVRDSHGNRVQLGGELNGSEEFSVVSVDN